jgi:hypothetical protein
MMSLAERREAMHAADLVDTHSAREAAVLGGIVRSVIGTGRTDLAYVAHYVRDILGVFNLVGVDRSPPCGAEIAMVLERFEAVHRNSSAE